MGSSLEAFAPDVQQWTSVTKEIARLLITQMRGPEKLARLWGGS